MDNMQVQGTPMGQEEQMEQEEIKKAQAAGVIDFNKKEEPEKSLNYTHKFAKPTEIMGKFRSGAPMLAGMGSTLSLK